MTDGYAGTQGSIGWIGKMKKNSFIQGAVILAVSGIIVKLIGAVSRIYLSRLLGGEGIGLYQMAYPIYLLCLSISTAGLPVAISIMVSERNAIHDFLGGQRILKIALSVLTLTGLLFSVGLYFGSSVLIDHHIVRDPRAYWSLIALAPAVFCATISATMRGYFQGLQNMTPTAVSEVIEQFIRVVTMIGLAIILLPKGLEFGAAGATFGAAPGAAAAILTLGWFYWHDRKHRKMWYMSQDKSIVPDSTWNIMKRLFILAIPVSCANIMIPIVSNIDLFIVPKRLEVAGFNVEQATTLFGYLTGMATALINMPTIVTSSMSSSLVPGISEASIKKDFDTIRRRARTALRLASVFTLPAAIGLGVIATPISTMLYATPNAGPCIAVMSIGIFFLGIQQVTTGILQGLGKTAVPFINLIVSGCVKVAFSWNLTAMPQFGVLGAAFATDTDFAVAAALNLLFLYRYMRFNMDYGHLLKVAIASAVMGVAVYFSFGAIIGAIHSNTLSALLAICIGVVVYALGILLTKAIKPEDVRTMPKIGPKLAAIIEKISF
ncbi:polysaccharide biosynthesis protein [Allisonella histaminiformans]|uniref:putative polysaccharide biosynthesis protein n=1 Tax=Allisonella histaminiformans TaxID=209880 RepID=UPI002E7A5558|nr:polysaccharide biosynthesis protein [Allisonella histaminiformans]